MEAGRHRGAAAVATSLALALLTMVLGGCGGGASSTSAEPGASTAPATSSITPTDPSSSVATGPHAVAGPGPFRAPLRTADMLVLRQHSIPARLVRRIQHVPGVADVLQFSWAQVSIEDHAINVASVDPAAYRNFTTYRVATFQPEWERVAGGELALRARFRKQVGTSGYVRLGARAHAPRVHVGAYSPQIPQVDAVVNQSWARTLGMPQGNALLISTGDRTPAALRTPVQRIAGRQASVQRLDVAARLGLDPHAVQAAILVGSAASAVGSYTYTVLGGGRISPSAAWVSTHISTETMPIVGPMTCNTQMFPQLRAALEEIAADGLSSAIHPQQYGGCFVPRFIAGTTTLSNHAFGLAFDLNVPENERGTVGQMNRQVVAIFEKWGFTWGGTWGYTDPMHFELNRIVHPG